MHATTQHQKKIIPRKEHAISRDTIPAHVLIVLKKLNAAGFDAYLVGGCVRDLLLNHVPKDFDVATNAKPDEIRGVFRNCRLIGKRFRLAHIYFKNEIVEVATFRAYHGGNDDEGMVLRDNVYGTMEEDAFRRDFTINALYYTLKDFSVIDYTNGISDLKKGVLRMIGDPKTRYKEDPVRILRAIRFISKINFKMHEDTERPIATLTKLLEQVSSARLFHEALKIFHGGYALHCFNNLQRYHLIKLLLPDVDKLLRGNHPFLLALLEIGLANTDARIANHQTASPAFLFAMFLWYPTMNCYKTLIKDMPPQEKIILPLFDNAMQHAIYAQNKRVAIPKQLAQSMQDIWRLQPGMERMHRGRVEAIFQHPRFRAAYDLLLLRKAAGEDIAAACTWWTDFIAADLANRETMANPSDKPKKKRRKKKKKSLPPPIA